MYIFFLLALFCGATTVTSGIFNSNIANKLGTNKSILINFITGLIPSTLYFIYYFSNEHEPIILKGIPPYLFIAGLISVLAVILCNIVYKQISAVVVTLLIFIGQILTGTIIDMFFLDKKVSVLKVAGIIIITLGIYLSLIIDRRNSIKETEKLNK